MDNELPDYSTYSDVRLNNEYRYFRDERIHHEKRAADFGSIEKRLQSERRRRQRNRAKNKQGGT